MRAMILVIEEEPDLSKLFGILLGVEGYDVRLVRDWREAREALAERAPDLIIFNAKVFTSDPATPRAEALAITGDHISAVGTSDQIKSIAGDSTKRSRLRAKASRLRRSRSTRRLDITCSPTSTVAWDAAPTRRLKQSEAERWKHGVRRDDALDLCRRSAEEIFHLYVLLNA